MGRGAAHHRIEHLGGGDHRNAQAVALADELLLQQRHLLGGHLHTQIAAGHHHPVAQGQDRVDLIDRFKLLDLGHHRGVVAVGGNQSLDLLHVGGIAHKAERHPIHVLFEAEGEIGAVFIGEGAD